MALSECAKPRRCAALGEERWPAAGNSEGIHLPSTSEIPHKFKQALVIGYFRAAQVVGYYQSVYYTAEL